jgi:pimeloyl-ACP methyl ester carboxylesterase
LKQMKKMPEDMSVGHFASPLWQEKYFAAYDELMAAMPHPSKVLDISTSWGIVRGYEWTNVQSADIPPVVLLPGRSSGVPMWKDNLATIMSEHTVYAFDALGDAGKSVQTVPFNCYEDVAGWMSETIGALGAGKVHIAGHSFGGGFAANFALLHPEQVATVALLDPAFALNYPSAEVLFWATVASMSFLPKSWRDCGLAKMTGAAKEDVASDEQMARMITAASAGYIAAKLPTPKTLSKDERAKFSLPLYVAIGGKSPITGAKAVKNAQSVANATVRVYSDATHSLPMEYPEDVGAELNTFWRLHETSRCK